MGEHKNIWVWSAPHSASQVPLDYDIKSPLHARRFLELRTFSCKVFRLGLLSWIKVHQLTGSSLSEYAPLTPSEAGVQ